MARHISTGRLPASAPARAPAFRSPAAAVPRPAPEAATPRRYPGAPGARAVQETPAPVLAPCLHIRDRPPRWYGIGGTG